jgi:hypothetical protein
MAKGERSPQILRLYNEEINHTELKIVIDKLNHIIIREIRMYFIFESVAY